MKKSIYLLLIILVTGLVSCENNEAEFKNLDYYILNTSFIYPDDTGDNYVFLFNGDTLSPAGLSYIIYVAASHEGTLEVVEKGQTTAEYSQELILSEHTVLQFIKISGQPVKLYSANDYTIINNRITFLGEEYKTVFNGYELTKGLNYYQKSSGLSGALEIYKDGIEQPIYTQQQTIAETGETVIALVQLEEQVFLNVPEDIEPDPASDQQVKIRFFYTSSALPDVERIKIIVYDWGDFSVHGEVEMNVGELSPYITIDWSSLTEGGGLCQDIINVATDEKIVDAYEDLEAVISIEAGLKYKKATCMIGEGGVKISPIVGFSTKW